MLQPPYHIFTATMSRNKRL